MCNCVNYQVLASSRRSCQKNALQMHGLCFMHRLGSVGQNAELHGNESTDWNKNDIYIVYDQSEDATEVSQRRDGFFFHVLQIRGNVTGNKRESEYGKREKMHKKKGKRLLEAIASRKWTWSKLVFANNIGELNFWHLERRPLSPEKSSVRRPNRPFWWCHFWQALHKWPPESCLQSCPCPSCLSCPFCLSRSFSLSTF